MTLNVKITHKLLQRGCLATMLVILFILWQIGILGFQYRDIRHDTRASYSDFYYSVNCIVNGEFPLWDPYTHAGQPFYLHALKRAGGEGDILIFGLVAKLTGASIVLLYKIHLLLHFLVFALGNYFLACVLFRQKWTPLVVLAVTLFSNLFFMLLSQDGSISTLEYVPWLLLLMVRFRCGRVRNVHIVGGALLLLLATTNMDILFSSIYLLVFLVFSIFAPRPKPQWQIQSWVIIISAILLVSGLSKPLFLKKNQNLITPSLRAFHSDKITQQPRLLFKSGDIDIHLKSWNDQIARVQFLDYANLVVPWRGISTPLKPECGARLEKFMYRVTIDYFLYLGILSGFFTIYGLLYKRNWWQMSFLASGVVTAWISMGPDFLLSRILLFIPVLKTVRVMEHFSLTAVYISGIFLAAYGLEGAIEDFSAKRHGKRFIITLLFFLLVLGCFSMGFYKIIKDPWQIAFTQKMEAGIETWKVFRVFRFIAPSIALAAIAFEQAGKRRSWFFILWLVFAAILNISPAQRAYTMDIWWPFLVLLSAILLILGFVSLRTALPIRRTVGLIASIVTLFYAISDTYLGFNDWAVWWPSIVCFGVVTAGLFLSSKNSTKLAFLTLCCALVLDNHINGHLMTYFPPEKVDLPTQVHPFQYAERREEKIHVNGTEGLLLRKPMLFLRPSVYGDPEYDFYMTKHSWKNFTNIPEQLSRQILGIDTPILRFYSHIRIENDTDFINRANYEDISKFDELVLSPDEDYIPAILCKNSGMAFISIKHYSSNKLELEINAPNHGYLYYSDGHFPGWRCWVDNNNVKIYRAYIAFKAVPIPAGQHHVVFLFRPTGYLITMIMFLLSTAIAGILFIVLVYRERYYFLKTIPV